MSTVVQEFYYPDRTVKVSCPLFMASVSAGFPSPAEGYIEGRLDLNRHLIKHPAATFFVRVAGDSMIDAGIHPGDILVVDRAVEPSDGRVVIADDLLATGGTAAAVVRLVEQLGGQVVGLAFVVELEFLPGRERLKGYDVRSLLKYQS